MAETKILQCSKLLASKGLTIAFAESATAGWLCSEFALAPESGKVLKGGIVCYDATLKERLLGVPHALIEQFTPGSEAVTREMAVRLAKVIDPDIQIAVTGPATPGGSENPEKPVGTMFVYGYIRDRPIKFRKVFSGSCEEVIRQTIIATAQLLIDQLQRQKLIK